MHDASALLRLRLTLPSLCLSASSCLSPLLLFQHPGGRKIILKNSGKDVSEIWWNYHSETIFKKTAQKFRIGDRK